MNMTRVMTLFVLLLAGAQGCSTILNGTSQQLMITTVPPGARATVGTQSCVTPCSLFVKRDSNTLSVQKGNYIKTVNLESDIKLGSTICGNICWAIVPGMLFDFIAGGAYEIRPVNLYLDITDTESK